jgi:2-polyprenyl-6-methoxyphenol hydroxylase-like FAD-dependent oxidoreductase
MNGSRWDVIVVGARVAGAPTAMLLARRGLRVLVVDRAAFPSDTLSTHQVQLPGVARLARWGLLDRIEGAGTPATRQVLFDRGWARIEGSYPRFDGVDALYSPRRTHLDAVLVDAAREAGAEVRERFVVEEILIEDGVVSGIRGHEKGGPMVEERSALVVGADGKRSMVAEAVGAEVLKERPVGSMACYTYWDGLPTAGGEIHQLGRSAIGLWPTDDGLTLSYLALPVEEFPAFRADVDAHVRSTFAVAPEVAERIGDARRAERFRMSPDLPNRVLRSFGPGWALVGDAGLVMDPITGQGIGNAFRDADLVSGAVVDGLGGARPLQEVLADYQRRRDDDTAAMFEFTVELASFKDPAPKERVLFEALEDKPEEISRFLAVIAGAEPMSSFFAPGHLVKLMGVRGMARAMLGRRGTARHAA